MEPVKEKTSEELSRVKNIRKELLGNHQPDIRLLVDIFTRYKCFIEENKSLFGKEKSWYFKKELDLVEALVQQYHEVTGSRDKRFLLNDAFVGLMFDISESIDELASQMETDGLMAQEN